MTEAPYYPSPVPRQLHILPYTHGDGKYVDYMSTYHYSWRHNMNVYVIITIHVISLYI